MQPFTFQCICGVLFITSLIIAFILRDEWDMGTGYSAVFWICVGLCIAAAIGFVVSVIIYPPVWLNLIATILVTESILAVMLYIIETVFIA